MNTRKGKTEMKRFGMVVDAKTFERWQALAHSQNMTMSDFVRTAVDKSFDNLDTKTDIEIIKTTMEIMSTALTQKILVEFGKTESYLRQLAETVNDVADIAEQNVQSVRRNTAYLVTAVEELAPESLTVAEQRYSELFAENK